MKRLLFVLTLAVSVFAWGCNEPPTVTTSQITDITQSTATGGGEVTSDGGTDVTARGVVWSRTSNAPTIDDNDGKTADGTGTGIFSSNLTGLSPGADYYVRAYATNSEGTSYGNVITFSTSPGPPTVTTSEISNITQNTASGGGEVTLTGGSDVTARGVVWSIYTEPSLEKYDGKTEDSTGTGTFTSAITGLTAATTYYVRAYATNSVGTVYGNEVGFTTLSDPAPDPIADPGADTIGRTAKDPSKPDVMEIVYLSGEASLGLEFAWSVVDYEDNETGQVRVSQQQNTSGTIPEYRFSSANTPVTGFSGGKSGKYTLQLEVSNGEGKSDSAQVTVQLIDDYNNPIVLPDYFDNYYNEDVDGDGVPDIQDDFPLDPAKTRYPSYAETKEPAQSNVNDGIGVSEDAGTVPLIITGSITAVNNRVDIDFYKIEFEEAGRYSAVLEAGHQDMDPSIAVIESDGTLVPNTRANMPDIAGVTAVGIMLSTAGTYYLTVTDSSGNSDPEWTYSVKIFKDTDLDGISDDLEIALGSDYLSADSDGDGISDFVEISWAIQNWELRDINNDGYPLWWDFDSDGDGIPDSVEYYSSADAPELDAQQLDLLNDADSDGVPNFLDEDSNGNGILDAASYGLNPWEPIDTDGDNIPDFIDPDTDGDGLLDLNEDKDHIRIPLEKGDDDFLLLTSILNKTLDIEGFCSAGDAVSLIGKNLPSDTSKLWIILRGGENAASIFQTIYNLEADNITSQEIDFTVPSDIGEGVFEVFVTTDNQRTESLALTLIDANTPLLTGYDFDSNTGNLTLYGFNLNQNLTVNFTGDITSKDNSGGGAGSVTLSVPANARSGNLYVSSDQGDSNIIAVSLTRNISGNIVLPSGSSVDITDLDVALSAFDEVFPDESGSFNSQAPLNKPSVSTALIEYPDSTEEAPRYASLLMSITLPGENQTDLNAHTTALALVWLAIGVEEMLSEEDLQDARNLLKDLPEIIALGDILETKLAENPYVLSELPMDSDIEDASKTAILAAALAIENNFDTTSDPSSKILHGMFGPQADVNPSKYKPNYWTLVEVYERGDTGNVNINNDSQLYLSAKISDMEDNVLHPHIKGLSGMAGPQGYGLLFWSQTTEYSQSKGKNCIVEVLSPGVARSVAPNVVPAQVGAQDAWNLLYFRTIIERVIWPFINSMLGLGDASPLVTVLFGSPTVTDIVINQVLQGNVKGSISALIDMLVQDMFSVPPGPITQELAKKYGKGFIEKQLAKAAAKLGANFVPVLGQVKFAIDVAGHVTNATYAGKAIQEISSTDSVIHFEVTFPLSIKEVKPGKVKPDGTDRQFNIHGSGFSPILRGIWPFKRELKPKIKATDAQGYTASYIKPSYINPNGTVMTITIPGWFLSEYTEGPISVEVHHPTDISSATAEKEDAIYIVKDIALDSISPNRGSTGISATIYGAGFSKFISDNEVTVGGLNALISSSTESTLLITIPTGLDPRIQKVVARVRQDGVWSDWSNPLGFLVEEGTVRITVCDNGGLKDDAFSLFVDGLYQGTLYANNSKYCETYTPSLSIGTHSARLLGVEAPDAIGTYSIAFEGVSNVTGDPLSGSDLVPGVSKFYTFEVTAPSNKVFQKNTGAPYSPKVLDIESTDIQYTE